MARYLAVGNLGYKEKQDMKILFSHPEAEFLHLGPGRDVFGIQKRRSREIFADLKRKKYDLICAGSTRFPRFNPRKGFLNNLANVAGKYFQHPHLIFDRFPYAQNADRLVGLDLECCPVIDNRRFLELDLCICYFKRDLPQNPCNAFLYTHFKTECSGNVLQTPPFDRWVSKLRPISLGIDDSTAAQLAAVDIPKKTDVFFAGDLANRPNRMSGIHHLEHLKSEGYNIDIALERIPYDEFIRRCAQAYIAWSPEGLAWDCYRHYEVAASGTVPLMQVSPSYCYAPFMDGENALFYNVEGNHLAARVRQALQNRARLMEIGRAARQHVLQWHTHGAIGRYVIKEALRTLEANGKPE